MGSSLPNVSFSRSCNGQERSGNGELRGKTGSLIGKMVAFDVEPVLTKPRARLRRQRVLMGVSWETGASGSRSQAVVDAVFAAFPATGLLFPGDEILQDYAAAHRVN